MVFQFEICIYVIVARDKTVNEEDEEEEKKLDHFESQT